MSEALTQASQFLDGLLADLYRRSGGMAAPAPPAAVPVIDDPALARALLAAPEVFVKNYAFLDALARGRFSSNGDQWRAHAGVTADWYRAAHRQVDPATARAIYARHLAPDAELDAASLYARFTAAAVEIFSCAIGMPAALAWPQQLLARMRDALRLRQWIDWQGCTPAMLARVQDQLDRLREEMRALWEADPDSARLLGQLRARGAPVDGFDAAEELIQNVLASSETTASSLLWSAEALSRQPQVQEGLAGERQGGPAGQGDAEPDSLDRFIAEVLRMFPPVPYLTRRCIAGHEAGGVRWQAGSVLSISIVGIHRNPDWWRAPAQFDAARPEFDAGATPFAYFPFSRGERVCAGMRLARIELRAGLEALLAGRRCLAGVQPTGFGYGLSSTPKTGLRALRKGPSGAGVIAAS